MKMYQEGKNYFAAYVLKIIVPALNPLIVNIPLSSDFREMGKPL